MISRRRFLAVAAGALAPGAVVVARGATLPLIGLLANSRGPHLESFREGLRALGYVEGGTIRVEFRHADSHPERLPGLAAALVRLPVDVLVAPDPPSAAAARAATATIPVVIRSTSDPVAIGFVTSLARPGGNVTGVYSLSSELVPKRLELLKQAIPGLSRVGMLGEPNAPGLRGDWTTAVAAAGRLGLVPEPLEVKSADDLPRAFELAARRRAGAILSLRSPLIVTSRARIVRLAAEHRMPVMYDDREFAEAGGLMSYGADLADLYRRLAWYVDRILKGAAPATLPVEQATTFELVVNRTAARALGLTLPPALLLQATLID